jgi:choline dehydrogenase-like flavoprotein
MTNDQQFDVAIIGTGAGGGTLGHRLAMSGKRVLWLERGSFLPRELDNWDSREVFVRGKYLATEQWYDGHGHEFQPEVNYYVGGNTKFYGAALFRLRPEDFGEITHHGGLSPAWPIDYADLEPYYSQAEQLYKVHGRHGEDPTEGAATLPYPHEPVSHEPRIQQLSDDMEALGLHPFHLPIGVDLHEDENGRPDRLSPCIRCSKVDGFPCLLGTKSDAQTICVEPVLDRDNVTLVTGAEVLRLETDPSGRSVTSIVGRHYMRHNNVALMAVSKEPNPTTFQKTLAMNDWYAGADDFDYPLGGIQMLGKSDDVMIHAQAPRWAGKLSPKMPFEVMAHHAVDFWLCGEDLPRADSRVTLDKDGAIHLDINETNNVEGVKRLRHKLDGMLERLGMHPDHLLDHSLYLHKSMPIGATAHQAGTVRFGTDPLDSALDPFCRAHDLDNLYVVDTSFFPSIGAVNPSLTAIANALRVGDHLLERLA